MSLQVSPDPAVLTCWKDIARYFGKGVRTVQRWERHLGLPVRRPSGIDHKTAVVAYPRDLEAWIQSRWAPRCMEEGAELDNPPLDRQSLFAELSNGLRVSRALQQEMRVLRNENRELVHQLSSGLAALRQSCQQSLWAADNASDRTQKTPAKAA